MKLLSWLFSITDRHRREIFRYERGGRGRRLATLLIAFLWIALLFLCEFGFLYVFHNPPTTGNSGWDMHFIYLLFLGAFSIGMLPMALDYCICFSYVGFKMAIIGRTLNERQCEKLLQRNYDISREIRNFRLLDLFLSFLFLGLAALTAILFFALLFQYGNYFPSQL